MQYTCRLSERIASCVFSLAERLGFCKWIAVSHLVRTIVSVYAVGQISVSLFDRCI